MTATDLELVTYDYFAERLRIKLKTVQVYATSTDPEYRREDFPRPEIVVGGVPYFRRDDADRFISGILTAPARPRGRAANAVRLGDTTAVTSRIYTLGELTSPDLVGYDYFAEQLDLDVKTIRIYATSKSKSNRVTDFPAPAGSVRGRGGHPSPRFRKGDADKFIAGRRAKAQARRSRSAATDEV